MPLNQFGMTFHISYMASMSLTRHLFHHREKRSANKFLGNLFRGRGTLRDRYKYGDALLNQYVWQAKKVSFRWKSHRARLTACRVYGSLPLVTSLGWGHSNSSVWKPKMLQQLFLTPTAASFLSANSHQIEYKQRNSLVRTSGHIVFLWGN